MDIKVEKLDKNETKLIVKLNTEEQADYETQTATMLSNSVKISGFRAGKAPLEMVKNHIGEEKFTAYLLETFIPEVYAKAIKSEKLIPVSHPTVKVIKESPIEIEATFANIPDLDLAKVEKIKIKAPTIKVSKDEIKKELERIQKQHSSFKEVKRAAKKGDRVEIDFEGFDTDKKALPNTKSKNHPLVLGEGGFIPGFEENILGLSLDEKKEFEVVFPKDYHAKDFQNKKVVFKVKLNKVEEVITPKFDEEFIEKVSGKKQTKEEFEKELKAEIEHHKLHHAEAEQEEDFFKQLLEKCQFEISDLLIKEEAKLIKEDFQRESLSQGMDYTTYEKMLEAKEKKTAKEIYNDRAQDRVKLRFILDKLINDLVLDANEKEIEAQAKERLEATPEIHREKAGEYYQKGNSGYNAIRNEIILNKLYDKYIERTPHSCPSK